MRGDFYSKEVCGTFNIRILILLIISVSAFTGFAAALPDTQESIIIDVISPFKVTTTNTSSTPMIWTEYTALHDVNTEERLFFWVNVTKTSPEVFGEVVLEINITNSDVDMACSDISSLNVSNSSDNVWNPILLGSACSEDNGHVKISPVYDFDIVNPVIYNYSILFSESSEGANFTIMTMIKQASEDTTEPISLFSGDERLIANFSDCIELLVDVNSTLPSESGDYWIKDCTMYESDKWNCTLAPEFDVWLATKKGISNTYNLTSTCVQEDESGGSCNPIVIIEPIEVCESHWTECIEGLSYRYCMKGELNTTRVKNCTSDTIICIPKWFCSDWGECRPTNTQLKTCTDLNECGTNVSKPSTSQPCTYIDDNGSGDDNGNGGGGGSGGSGGGSSTDTSDDRNTDNIKGWICDPWGSCIDGRRSAFCYRYIRDSGLNYTKSEDCEEELPELDEELEEPPIVIVGGEPNTNNETLPPAEGSMGITGMFGLALPKQPWLWALLLVLVIAFLIFLAGKRNKSFLIAAGKRKKEKK